MNFSDNDDDDLVSSDNAGNYSDSEDTLIQARRKRLWRTMMVIPVSILGILSAICAVLFVSAPKEQSYATLKRLVPFLPTLTPTPLFADAEQDYFATATAYPAVARGEGFRDEFNASDDAWCLGDDDDNWSTNSFRIEGGQYLWSVTAKRDMILRCTLDEVISLPDQFYLTVAASAVGTDNAEAVLIFHKTESGSYYLLSLYPASQAFDVYLYMDEEWIELIPYTSSTSIDSAGLNQMVVVADGPRYVFFINGEYVGTVEDDRLSGGSAGPAISLDEGTSADFVFDDFEVKYP